MKQTLTHVTCGQKHLNMENDGELCFQNLFLILRGIHPGWWLVSLNPKDDHLHVPIHPPHWWYLWFALRNLTGELTLYQWKVLPFRLATTPRDFSTKLPVPVATHLN